MRIELMNEGKNVAFVVIASQGDESYQNNFVTRTSFPLFQDTMAVNAWVQHGGVKDDIFVYDTKGKLARYLKYGGTQNTNLSEAANDAGTSPYTEVKKIIADTQ